MWLLALAASCAPIDATPTADAKDASTVCYPGLWDLPVCVALVPLPADMALTYPDAGDLNPEVYAPPQNALPADPIFAAGLFLSSDFRLEEFLDPAAEVALVEPYLVDGIQWVRDQLQAPVFISSGYREPLHNAEVGGSPHSRHMYGDAVDVWSPDLEADVIAEACELGGASFVKVYDGHVHCDWRWEATSSAFR